MWIKEYVSWFNALVKYGFELVNNQEKKAMKFAMGLNSPLGELILNQILYGVELLNGFGMVVEGRVQDIIHK